MIYIKLLNELGSNARIHHNTILIETHKNLKSNYFTACLKNNLAAVSNDSALI